MDVFTHLKQAILICLFMLIASCCYHHPTISPLTGNASNTDNIITTNVQTRLAGEPVLSDQNISVITYERVVTLRGHVQNPTQANVAYVLAKSVPDVKWVKSYITVKPIEYQ